MKKSVSFLLSYYLFISCVQAAPSALKASEDFQWKWEFSGAAGTNVINVDIYNNTNGSAAPDTVRDWDFTVGSPTTGKTAQLNGDGVLELITPGGTTGYAYLSSRIWQISGITQATGYTVEFRMKVVQDHGSSGINYSLNPNDVSTEIGKGNISSTITNFGSAVNFSSSNSDDYHIYRISAEYVSGNIKYSIWRDGELLGDNLTAPSNTDSDQFLFGDLSNNYAGEYHIDYIRLQSGAFSPEPESAGTLIQLSGFSGCAGLCMLLLGLCMVRFKRS